MAVDFSTTQLTLRQLPLPARLVLSAFLIAVGLGYFSALVQLHLKHSSKVGDPLPTATDVIEIFSGLKPYDPKASPSFSKIDTLISGDRDAADVSKENMAPAFLAKSKGWQATISAPAANRTSIENEREGERQAMLAWVRADAVVKKDAYEKDAFMLPDEIKNRPITADFLTPVKDVKIRTLVDLRCQNCHNSQAPSLASYEEISPLVTPPSTELIDGKWVRSSRQVTVEGLTQSTHAHLLSFSVLFTLTGLVFALTTYPGLVRGILGPIVLIAQVCDIACWWLARVPTYGPFFAQAIMGTGAVVGVGLVLQILFSLLNMYGSKGKLVVLLILISGTGLFAFVGLKVIQPALDAERLLAEERSKPANEKTNPLPPTVAVASQLERLITGPRGKDVPFNGRGSMASAFYEKDGADYKDILKKKPGEKLKLDAEREGEQMALKAWLNADPDARKKAYDDDRFPLPPDRVGKPVTEDYLIDGNAVKVKSILTDRCVQCHAVGQEQEDYPLETYEQLMKYVPGKQ